VDSQDRVSVELSFSEWAFLAGFLGSFKNMLAEYLKSGQVEFPDHFLAAAHNNPERFAQQLALVHNRLARIAADGTQEVPARADHEPPLILVSLTVKEFATLWIAWRATEVLFSQEVNGEELSISLEKFGLQRDWWPTFERDLAGVLDRNPVPRWAESASRSSRH
jgi:hypothetical protein